MNNQHSRILIIDDDPGVRESYEHILSSAPASDIMSKGMTLFADQDAHVPVRETPIYDVTLADCGEAGVKAVQAAMGEQRPYAAAFVDMMMPGIDGAETTRQIWQLDPDIKIVIVTAYSDYTPDDIVELVGREDLFYLRKPFNPAEIKQFARALISQWDLEREKAMLTAKLDQAREKELLTAARIQQTLLLAPPPGSMPAIELHQKNIPSQKIDGDFVDFIRFDPWTLDVVVGDVMGKGIPAALTGAALKNRLQLALNDLMRGGYISEPPEPEQIVAAVQAAMIEQLEELETFVTLCYARFDLAAQMIRFVDCGHMRTIHLDNTTGVCRLLEGVNMPLGFPETEAITQMTARFQTGDLFVFYSDGLTEAQNRQDEMYGEQRLVDFVQQHLSGDPIELVENIFRDVVAFSQSDSFTDDFTCIGVRIMKTGSSKAVQYREEILEFKSDLNELAKVREFTRDFCIRAESQILDASRIDLIELAVDEAVVNVVKHAYREEPGHPVKIKARMSKDKIEFHLYDWGRRFDPAAVPPPAFDGSQDHGFGVYIIQQAVDEIKYTREKSGRNCATMRVNLKGGGSSTV